MPKESRQKRQARTNPPRVHITYDVETNGAIEKKELPFVVGVLADLSGNPEQPLPKLKDRKFVDIKDTNFDTVMGKIEPRLTMKVANRLTEDDAKIPVELKFNELDDFSPAAVAEQVTPIRKLLEVRRALSNLRSNLAGNEKLEESLRGVLENPEALNQLLAEIGAQNTDSGDSK